jgi:hypothetical protein
MSSSEINERNDKRRFDRKLLDECIERDDAILILYEDKENIHYTRKSIIEYICKCGKESSKIFMSLADRSGAFCKECSKKNKTEKRTETCTEKYGEDFRKDFHKKSKATMKEKYGSEHALQVSAHKEKAKSTFKEKYGTDHPMKSKKIKEKIAKTCTEKYGSKSSLGNKEIRAKAKETIKEKYGVEHAIQNPEIKEKIAQTNLERYGVKNVFESPEFQEKAKQTLLENYGVTTPMHSEEIKSKITETNKANLGVEFPFQSSEVQEKAKNTVVELYGVENVFQSPEIQEKSKATCLEKYGVEHALQSTKIQQRQQESAYSYKSYITPSGKIRKVQGYEPYALDTLFNEYVFFEEDVITNRTDIPTITYTFNGETKYHFPDIYVKSLNKLIEVKSTWTYEKHKEQNIAKSKVSRDAGYQYEFWVFSSKGRSLTIHTA